MDSGRLKGCVGDWAKGSPDSGKYNDAVITFIAHRDSRGLADDAVDGVVQIGRAELEVTGAPFIKGLVLCIKTWAADKLWVFRCTAHLRGCNPGCGNS